MIETVFSILAGFIVDVISSAGYFGIAVFMAIESAAIPLPSEIIMPFSGYLAARGDFNFWLVVFSGTLGNVFGSVFAYYIGFLGGRPLIKRYGRYIFIRERELELADSWFKNYGQGAIFFSRLLPAIRTFISLPAGIAKMNMGKFILYTFSGSFFWTLGLAYIGYKLGNEWERIRIYFRQFDIAIVVIILCLVGWWVVVKLRNKK